MSLVSLRIDAPAHARNSDRITSHYGHGKPPAKQSSSGSKDLLRRILHSIPAGVSDAVFANLYLVNRLWFPSRPGGAPITREQGSWTFAVVGDYGQYTPSQQVVATNIARSGVRLIVTTGDNEQSDGTEADFQRHWDPVWGPLSRQFPVFPSVGNHDGIGPEGLTAYHRRFPHLDGARYYSHVQGDVHFIALDTNMSLLPGSQQLRWLDQQLASSRSKFRVVYMHHPLITQLGANSSRLLHDLGPILRRHGVQLVLTGHEHWYERSQIAGLTHVVVGNGGSTVAPFPFFQAPWSAFRDARYGHLEIEVQSGRLVGRMITRDGTVVDTFEVPPSAAVRDAAQGAQLVRQPAAA
jgi:acid phosphatase type 7